MKIGNVRVDRARRRLHGEAALDAECVGFRQGEDEDTRKPDGQHDGDDGNGFQHGGAPGDTRKGRTRTAGADNQLNVF